MTDRHEMFDHTIVLDQLRLGKWRARIYRSTFRRDGVIVGCAHVADLHAVTRLGAVWVARRLIADARKRGARWPAPNE